MSSKKPKLTLLDPGLGTHLQSAYSIPFSSLTPLWSSHLLLSPSGQSTLLSAQREFVDAGAEVLISATYQASFEGFLATRVEGSEHGVGEGEAGKYMRRGVEIAGEAFGRGNMNKKGRGGKGKGKVALSIGAYGACMIPSQEYSGLYDENHLTVEGLREWHLRRLNVFLPLGFSAPSSSLNENSRDEGVGIKKEKRECWDTVDLVAFETLPILNEILAAREVMALLPIGEEKPFWISCVFPGEGNTIPDGSSVEDVVAAMLDSRKGGAIPMGIGINCTRVGKVEGIILEMEDAVGRLFERKDAEGKGRVREWPALVVYPDGTMGEVYNTVTKEWEKVEGMEENSISWDEEVFGIVKRARVRRLWKEIFIGGCCKTGPNDIAKLRKRIDEPEKSES